MVEGMVKIRPMIEDDLSQIMEIEISSFDDPWTPLAFALELRHNPRAYYRVAYCDCEEGEGKTDKILGYVGWWDMPQGAAILRIAVASSARGKGVGKVLVEDVFKVAQGLKLPLVSLEVRSSNLAAQKFYSQLGFKETSILKGYYEYPDEDGVVMECHSEIPAKCI